ncbi:MAG: nucleotide exchange factor GrpE [Lachnospiraceae bacterium]|nr:nucleotide exchange factor GrpE [Lachnospiraceae bacterium]
MGRQKEKKLSKEEAVKINIESGEDEGSEKEENKDIPEEKAGDDTKENKEAKACEDDTVKEDAPSDNAEKEAGDGAEKEAQDEPEKEGKKKHFGKKNKKDSRDEKIEQLEDRVKRQMAEFENFRKRTDKEKSQMFDMGAKSVIEKILPVIDNFERGLENVPEGCDEAFVSGMQMIYKQMTDEFEKLGVKPIEAVGQPFDPNFHNAVMQTESDEYESGTVAQELQKGYMYHDTLVRPSMVSVVS